VWGEEIGGTGSVREDSDYEDESTRGAVTADSGKMAGKVLLSMVGGGCGDADGASTGVEAPSVGGDGMAAKTAAEAELYMLKLGLPQAPKAAARSASESESLAPSAPPAGRSMSMSTGMDQFDRARRPPPASSPLAKSAASPNVYAHESTLLPPSAADVRGPPRTEEKLARASANTPRVESMPDLASAGGADELELPKKKKSRASMTMRVRRQLEPLLSDVGSSNPDTDVETTDWADY
jgi:hypothetical protein